MDGLGAQIGLFLGRRQAEEQAAELLERKHVARADVDAAVRDDLWPRFLTTCGRRSQQSAASGSGAVDAVLGRPEPCVRGADRYRYRA